MSMFNGSGRPRFIDTFRAALSPREQITVDPDAPNPMPRTVTVAGWLTLAAGLLTAVVGLLYIFGRHASIQGALDQIVQCKQQGVGVGAAVSTTDSSELATTCKSLIDPTAEQVSSALTSLLYTGVIVLVVGLGVLFAGYGLLKGTRWGRRMATILGALLLIGTMLGIFAHLFLLLAALLLIISLSLTYVGKGATYYIRAKAKGVK